MDRFRLRSWKGARWNLRTIGGQQYLWTRRMSVGGRHWTLRGGVVLWFKRGLSRIMSCKFWWRSGAVEGEGKEVRSAGGSRGEGEKATGEIFQECVVGVGEDGASMGEGER